MTQTLLRTQKDFKGKIALQELRRAHAIIALLSGSLSFILIIMSLYPVQLDSVLALVAAALLILIAAISVSIAFGIKIKK
ncbi:hypothetical protein H7142_03250 [Candidatus Saccharibacteria bacterium]|nr:hypothetical protein [Candidatus Saccharibacteria bacterium]